MMGNHDRQKNKISFLEEREKLQKNVAEARRIAEKLLVINNQMKDLIEKVETSRADTMTLKIELNHEAIRIGLLPIAVKTDIFNNPEVNDLASD